MKNKSKRFMSLLLAVLFLSPACASNRYSTDKGPLISVVQRGLQKNGEFYKRGAFNQGLVKAVEPNEKAMVYVRRSSKNKKWYHALLWPSLASFTAGGLIFDANQGNTARNNASLGLIYGGIGLFVMSLVNLSKSEAGMEDAVNKYNDDVMKGMRVENKEEVKNENGAEESPKNGTTKSYESYYQGK